MALALARSRQGRSRYYSFFFGCWLLDGVVVVGVVGRGAWLKYSCSSQNEEAVTIGVVAELAFDEDLLGLDAMQLLKLLEEDTDWSLAFSLWVGHTG